MSSSSPFKPDLSSSNNSTITSSPRSSFCLSHSKAVTSPQTETSQIKPPSNMLFRSVSANDAVPRVCRTCGMSSEMLHLYGLYAIDLIPSSNLEDDLVYQKGLSNLSIEESPCDLSKQPKIGPKINITTAIHPPLVWETESSSASSISGLEAELSDTPANFSQVLPGVYRSSFPAEQHFGYLKSLGLKSVVSVHPLHWNLSSDPIFWN